MFLTVFAVTAMRSFLNSVFSNFLFMSEDFSKVLFFSFSFNFDAAISGGGTGRSKSTTTKASPSTTSTTPTASTPSVATLPFASRPCSLLKFKHSIVKCRSNGRTIGWLWLYSCYYLRCYFQVC